MGITTSWFENYSRYWPSKRNADRAIATSERFQFAALLSRYWKSLLQLFECSMEPRVWQTHDRQGHVIWHLYDPSSYRTATFSSEAEVRIWLEERYHCQDCKQ